MANVKQASPAAVTLAGILSLAVAMGIGRFAFTPVLPLMIHEGRLDVAAGGWIAAANYAGYLLGALTASRLGWPAVRLGAVALVLTAMLTAAMAWLSPVWLWAAVRLAGGVASAWAFVATSVWCLGALAARGEAHRGSTVYSGVGFGIALAGIFCLAAATWGMSAPAIWVLLGVLCLVLGAPIAQVLRRLHVETSLAAAQPHRAESKRETRVPEGIRSLVICYGMLGFGYILPATFLPVMARALVSDPRVFGLAWPVFGLTAAASTFIAGWALRRATRLQVWAVSNVVMGLGVLLPSVWPNAITVALSALMVGGTFMIVTLAGLQEARARVTGDPTPLLARMTSAFALGQIAGPIASSLLLHVPRFAQSGLDIALQLAAVSLFASAAWLWRADRAPHATKEMSHAR
jgi:MFS family permease